MIASGWFRESMAKFVGPNRPCSSRLPNTKTGLLLLVKLPEVINEGNWRERASDSSASATSLPALVARVNGFLRSAISTASTSVSPSLDGAFTCPDARGGPTEAPSRTRFKPHATARVLSDLISMSIPVTRLLMVRHSHRASVETSSSDTSR